MNEKLLQHCAKCGSCSVVCPVYRVTARESLTARGKLHLLGTSLAEQPGRNFQDIFARCLLCGACEDACPGNIPVRKHVVDARSRFPRLYGQHSLQKEAVRMTLSRPKLLQGLVKAGIGLQNLSLLPANSGLRLKLGLLEQGKTVRQEPAPPARHSAGGEQAVSYFTGCLARYLQPSVAEATKRLYRDLGGNSLQVPDTQVCCGLAAWSAGSKVEARDLARKNITAFGETKGPILASCASCSSFLFSYPDLFADDPAWHARAVSFCARVREFSSFFLQSSKRRTFKAGKQTRIYYHEPCHLRFDRQNREAAHRLIERISGLVRLDTPEGQHCCGQGGLFHVGYPELAEEIFSRACAALNAAEPALVITTCSGCLLQWQAETAIRSMPVKTRHLAVFLADCLAESG